MRCNVALTVLLSFSLYVRVFSFLALLHQFAVVVLLLLLRSFFATVYFLLVESFSHCGRSTLILCFQIGPLRGRNSSSFGNTFRLMPCDIACLFFIFNRESTCLILHSKAFVCIKWILPSLGYYIISFSFRLILYHCLPYNVCWCSPFMPLIFGILNANLFLSLCSIFEVYDRVLCVFIHQVSEIVWSGL